MAEKTVQQRLTELESDVERLEGGQDALLHTMAVLVRYLTAGMDMRAAAELVDQFRVNVHPDVVATFSPRKRRAYEHTVQAAEMIATQFLFVVAGREEELAEALNPTRPKAN